MSPYKGAKSSLGMTDFFFYLYRKYYVVVSLGSLENHQKKEYIRKKE